MTCIVDLFLFENISVLQAIIPSAEACNVWSFPEWTLSPGCHLNPLYLASISFSNTSDAPQRFIPRRLPAESYLLLVEPAIIFVANNAF